MAKPEKKLYRSANDRMISGVCGGIGEYFDIDPTIIRLIAAALLICSVGTAVLVYFLMWIIIPEEPDFTEPIDVKPSSSESERQCNNGK